MSSPLYKRIAIIGGGPAGFAVAKALALEPVKFDAIDVFERRHELGGVWNYDGDKSKVTPSVPSTSNKDREHYDPDGGWKYRFFSPMYKNLETNLLKEVMEYHDYEFPKDDPFPFPARTKVLKYILDYTKSVSPEIKVHLNSNVASLSKENDWKLVIEDHKGTTTRTEHYDAVVIANGHFDIPFIPDVPGLKEWHQQDPKSITHAKYFNDATIYQNKNVLVVGNSSSGIDISVQLSGYAKNVYVSTRDPSKTTKIEHHRATHIGLVNSYDISSRSAVLSDSTVADIDTVIFCTGYLYDLPFLNPDNDLITNGDQIHNIYKQIFYVEDPSLSFTALNKNIVPMPLAESQGAVIARVYNGRYKLPSRDERAQSYQKDLERKGAGKKFHLMAFPEDVDYCHELNASVIEQGLHHEGFVAKNWSEEKIQGRKDNKTIKDARFAELALVANKRWADSQK